MKIKINKIDATKFEIRDEIDEEYLEKLSQSLSEDGQWNPIIVRPTKTGTYELIAGHYRLRALIRLGLKEIEATVKEVSDEDADFLSLKTNLLRLGMTPREEGKQLAKIIEQYSISQRELARRLNKNAHWVNDRVRLALDLHEDVVKALENKLINFAVATVIAGVSLDSQPILLQIIIERSITQQYEVKILRRQFLNDTLFTIGYQGRTVDEFIAVLKENKIDLVFDIRFSSDSQYKPEFNGLILKKELERNKIKYEHNPDLGIPHLLQTPYKEGYLGYDCLKQWYEWNLSDSNTVQKGMQFDVLVEYLKKSGRVALMCLEKSAKATSTQKLACHRNILAELILGFESEDSLLLFEKRVDL